MTGTWSDSTEHAQANPRASALPLPTPAADSQAEPEIRITVTWVTVRAQSYSLVSDTVVRATSVISSVGRLYKWIGRNCTKLEAPHHDLLHGRTRTSYSISVLCEATDSRPLAPCSAMSCETMPEAIASATNRSRNMDVSASARRLGIPIACLTDVNEPSSTREPRRGPSACVSSHGRRPASTSRFSSA